MKKLDPINEVYTIRSCLGFQEGSTDKFVTSVEFTTLQGPFAGATGELMSPCGLLGFNYYQDPDSISSAGAFVTDHNPANVLYARMGIEFNVFPIIAMTNPTVVDAVFNEQYCRTKNSANVISFDNRHSYRVLWPGVAADADLSVLQMMYDMTLTSYEIVWWVPDLSTVEDNKLVMTASETVTHELTQTNLRIRNIWLRRMFNAYICKHPVPDSTITDVTDLSGTTAFDTYNEPSSRAIVVDDDSMLPRTRDPKALLANGVFDRRKDARKLWMRKKVHRRPRRQLPNYSVVEVAGFSGETNIPQRTTFHTAGNKFNINKRMEWDQQTPDTDTDTTVREVCPRGVYVYVKYWYFQTHNTAATFESNALAPIVAVDLIGRVDKSHHLKWQN